MKLLIASATQAEVAPLLEKLSAKKVNEGNIFKADRKNISVDIMITGVGMVATAFAMGKYFGENSCDAALNLGLAGSFNRAIELGSVVNIVQDHFAEIGAEDDEKFLSLKEMNLEGEAGVMNENEFRNPVLELIPKVCGITVNTVHGNEKSIEKVFAHFHPDTESMEGAAFLYACKRQNMACAQVRAISNYVEKRNRAAWNIPVALEKLNSRAMEIINAF
ncbi:MAG TPA: futalosine hydrolase [Bacteroidia bacterium]|jgi:futalosine hydrolase